MKSFARWLSRWKDQIHQHHPQTTSSPTSIRKLQRKSRKWMIRWTLFLRSFHKSEKEILLQKLIRKWTIFLNILIRKGNLNVFNHHLSKCNHQSRLIVFSLSLTPMTSIIRTWHELIVCCQGSQVDLLQYLHRAAPPPRQVPPGRSPMQVPQAGPMGRLGFGGSWIPNSDWESDSDSDMAP